MNEQSSTIIRCPAEHTTNEHASGSHTHTHHTCTTRLLLSLFVLCFKTRVPVFLFLFLADSCMLSAKRSGIASFAATRPAIRSLSALGIWFSCIWNMLVNGSLCHPTKSNADRCLFCLVAFALARGHTSSSFVIVRRGCVICIFDALFVAVRFYQYLSVFIKR